MSEHTVVDLAGGLRGVVRRPPQPVAVPFGIMRRHQDGDTAKWVSSAVRLQSPPSWLEGQHTTGKSIAPDIWLAPV